jgi:hypothetical protein
VVSIVLVAAVKAYEGQLYGSPSERTVMRAYEAPPELLPPEPPLPVQPIPAAG